MYAGYIIFGLGLLALILSYILYKIATMPKKTIVTARELDVLWTELGKMIVQISENNMEVSFLRDLDALVGKCHKSLQLQPKNIYAEQNKKNLSSRLKELDDEIRKSPTPYKVEIRKYKLHNLAKLLGMQMPKR